MSTTVAPPAKGNRRRAMSLVDSASTLGAVLVFVALAYLLALAALLLWRALLGLDGWSVFPALDPRVAGLVMPGDATVFGSIAVASFVLWCGYCLRVLALIASTQLTNFE